MEILYQDFLIRDWQTKDRIPTATLIEGILTEYGLPWQPEIADRDVVEVEKFYLEAGGEFWVVEKKGEIVGTSAYYPIERGNKAVEIRKMYLDSLVRGKGLGKFLLKQLELAIASQGFLEVWLETASVLSEAVKLYESFGYQRVTEVETARCDRAYKKVLG